MMNLWRIVPAARLNDSRWEDHPRFEEVIVRAESAALARVVAAKALFQDNHLTQFGEERDVVFISGFDDEKLYKVLQIDATGKLKQDGKREVISYNRFS